MSCFQQPCRRASVGADEQPELRPNAPRSEQDDPRPIQGTALHFSIKNNNKKKKKNRGKLSHFKNKFINFPLLFIKILFPIDLVHTAGRIVSAHKLCCVLHRNRQAHLSNRRTIHEP